MGHHLENVRTIVKKKYLYNKSKEGIGIATAVIVPGHTARKRDLRIDFIRHSDVFVRRAI